MNVYTTDKIRNVVLLGHGGAGKTSLSEAMAYLAGITSRMGKVEDGNTLSDFDKEEQKRHISISTSTIPLEWDGHKINLLDTPGFFDFVGEVEEAAGVVLYKSRKAEAENKLKSASANLLLLPPLETDGVLVGIGRLRSVQTDVFANIGLDD